MKFDVIVGNPPYQEMMENTSDSPIYPLFLDNAYKIANIVITITPGRFLFNAGKTSKRWNQKMLDDDHIKVAHYEQDGTKIFPTTDIKGGVVILLRDANKKIGPIGVFSTFEELRTIFNKIRFFVQDEKNTLAGIYYSTDSFRFTDKMHEDFPDAESKLSSGHRYTVASSVFTSLPEIFKKEKSEGDLSFIGVINNTRYWRYIDAKYINSSHPNLNKYKVLIPGSNGSGAIGEVLSTPLVGEPLVGHTQTFISFGAFDSKLEAENCMKYIKTKFARTCLGILKITQSNKKITWKYVPLQDFTSSSDIDWDKSIHEIDLQLYKKYNLSDEEIDFIETRVREME